MENVVIVSACRTAIGALGGQFKNLTALDLSIPVMEELVKRAGIDPGTIDDVFWGCNYQKTYMENNLARVALVKAGLPVSVPGITLHRNCTSSMSALHLGFYQIRAGEGVCIVVGGADSMSTAPHMLYNGRQSCKFGHMDLRDTMWDSLTNLGIGPSMGITAENIAEKLGITRQEQDEYALRSQKNAIRAIDEGKFKDEIVPLVVREGTSEKVYEIDEYPRRDANLKSLKKLKPAFKENGTVTAGNASGMNDAAAGMIIMAESEAEKLGITPMAVIKSVATTGISPEIMGLGPVEATKKALKKAGLKLDDIDLIEVNEAFAVQYLGCERILGLNREITNVNGGGISLGHPVGATGVRIIISLLYEMIRREDRYGLATLCAGGGMGTATIIERVKIRKGA